MKFITVTLASLLTYVSPTTIDISIISNSESNSFEIGSEVSLECNYHFISHEGSKINDEQHEVTWSKGNIPIATASSLEEYQTFGYSNGIYGVEPNHNLVFAHSSNTVENSTEVLSYSSKLSAANIQIANVGEYKCQVRLLKTQEISAEEGTERKYVFNSAESMVSVFQIPSVSVSISQEEFDLRPLELDSELEKTQDIATCVISDAYPAPVSYEVVIGNRPMIKIEAASENIEINQNEESQLFSSVVKISEQLLLSDDNAQITCTANSKEYAETSEIIEETLNVLYFPEHVRVVFYNADKESVSYALPEEEIRVECEAISNPDSLLSLHEGEYVAPVVAVAVEIEEETEPIIEDEYIASEEITGETIEEDSTNDKNYYDYTMVDNEEILASHQQNVTSRRRRHTEDENHSVEDLLESVDEVAEAIEAIVIGESEVEAVAPTEGSILANTLSTMAALLQAAEPIYVPPHKIYSAAQETKNSYQCRATSSDNTYPNYAKLSEISSIPTLFLNAPTISVSSDSENPNKPSVGEKIKLSCASENLGNTANFAVQYSFIKDGETTLEKEDPAASELEIEVGKESAGQYSCSVSLPEVTRLDSVTSAENIEIDVASACIFDSEHEFAISAKSKTKQDGRIQNTFTCNIIGDDCKVHWIYDVEHFGKGQKRKNDIVFIDMPAATASSGSISCYGSNEEGLSRKAALNSNKIKSVEQESNTLMYLIGAIFAAAILLFLYKKNVNSKKNKEGEQISLNSTA